MMIHMCILNSMYVMCACTCRPRSERFGKSDEKKVENMRAAKRPVPSGQRRTLEDRSLEQSRAVAVDAARRGATARDCSRLAPSADWVGPRHVTIHLAIHTSYLYYFRSGKDSQSRALARLHSSFAAIARAFDHFGLHPACAALHARAAASARAQC